MFPDHWTILVLGGEDRPIRQIRLSSRRIRWAVAGLCLGCLTFLGLAVALGVGAPAQMKAQRLARENAVLAEELQAIRSRVEGLEGQLQALSAKDVRYRTLAGLDAIDEDVLEVGVGGPGMDTPQSHALWSVDSTLSKEAFAVAYDLNALERRARLLASSLDEASDSLTAHRDLMESTPSILPTAGFLSSGFSRSRLHPIHHRPLPHEGVDIAAPKGTPILAAAKGRVTFAGRKAGLGLTVELDHGYGYRTTYGHASKLLVREGQEVARGDVIAQVGSTGITTSSHLHYEVLVGGKPVNPMNFVLRGAAP